MTFDLTADFPYKKAYINSIEIQIKTVVLVIKQAEDNLTISYVEVLSRRGNLYKLDELKFS